MKYTPKQIKKALICAASFASALVANGVFTGTPALVVIALIGALGTYGVFASKNAPSA